MSNNDLILYSTDDGQAQFVLRELGGQVWLTQLELAELYQTSKQNISKHIKAVIADGEVAEGAVVNSKFTTATDGKRYLTQLYALPMIIAVGYRVRSSRGTQFRQWATRTLGEYMTKGFVMDDARLKEPGLDYFDELLERIRDIRSSEKRFYQKVRDLFTLAEDYKANEQATRDLFAQVQNKLFYAVCGKTAAEIVVERADPQLPNMGLTSFKGERVRKADVVIAKNYLQQDELNKLNRLVTMFLDFAEFRAQDKQHTYLVDWQEFMTKFLTFNDQSVLTNAGSISHKAMEQQVHQRYGEFDSARKKQEAISTDEEELKALETLEKKLSSTKK
ncbi:virulence RhuM family protein [Vibrio parahaemolyticus]|uniref:virulence RhuM family protein n=1 Tax=Vibrio parahaemolyticus TaxID=670 RepID=UPI001C92D3FD|nr:virulence RhuM family protein [Vibrio parahaemolyticus]ELV8697188.1 virulence RhuM family protein [Vibrio fluvialis]MBY4626834.1 virulence RhuM family protein [Vibrio parahaemolyticus]MCR9736108.1 virulence RhuM family protein [Vibrio parahaemolyticus]